MTELCRLGWKRSLIPLLLILLSLLLLPSCNGEEEPPAELPAESESPSPFEVELDEGVEVATFGGGDFRLLEPAFQRLPGVIAVVTGYTGGSQGELDFQSVSSNETEYSLALQVFYHPDWILYEELLDVYWQETDPTDGEGQFDGRGPAYIPVIYARDEGQRETALASIERLEESGRFDRDIVTTVQMLESFYRSEQSVQSFYAKRPITYTSLLNNSGKLEYQDRVWGEDLHPRTPETYTKPPDEELRERLTEMQYRVTQEEGTEPPFTNLYYDHYGDDINGIYVDIVSGEPLFWSEDQFESGTGWPSFTRPLLADHVVYVREVGVLGARFEVRSLYGDSHLGHVFSDGPEPTGQRYCMNSAALRFVPLEDLEDEGYGRYRWFLERDDLAEQFGLLNE